MPVPSNDRVANCSSLIELLEDHAENQSRKTAISFTGGPGAQAGKFTYGSLSETARSVAASLQRRCKPGDRAFLLFPSGLDYVVGMLGCLYAGVIAVPVNLPGPARVGRVLPKISGIAMDCKPAVVLTTLEIKTGSAKALAEMEQAFGCQTLCIDEETANAADWQKPSLSGREIAFLQYTSGSTGTPKGVINRHDGLLANNIFLTCLTRPHESSVTLSWLPLFHDMGLIMGVLNPLIYGTHAVLMPPAAFTRDPFSWIELASHYRATVLPGPSFGFQACADTATYDRLEGLDLSCIEAAVPAAEPVTPALVEKFSKVFEPVGLRRSAIKPSYGLAETTLIASGSAEDKEPLVCHFDKQALEENHIVEVASASDDARGYVANGAEFGGQELRIVDPESHKPLPDGTVGEIWVSGPAVASGYWNNKEASKETFEARLADCDESFSMDRLYVRTGDLGALHRGELFITGRLKDVMLFRGRCHYPNDIENTVQAVDDRLVAHGGAAFSIDRDGQENLVVVQEMSRSGEISDGDLQPLILKVRQAVGREHEVPVHAICLIRKGTLKKTTSGKIRRAEMRRLFLARELTGLAEMRFDENDHQNEASGRAYSEEEVGRLIRTLVGKALGGVSPHAVDPDIGFFDLGMDSVAALDVAAKLESQLGCKLPDQLLFDNPNVTALASFIADTQVNGDGEAASEKIHGRHSRDLDEPIAVIGIGCLMPMNEEGNAESADAFFDFLLEGGSAIRPAPKDRYDLELDIPGLGGFLTDVDKFDGPFFGVSAREAISTDPQQRLLLEVAWHALEDAGIPPSAIKGTDAGVFVGVGTNDYGHIPFLSGDPNDFDAYYGTGNSTAATAGRLSYFFGVEGPSISLDTACSSSLVSVHLALQSLRLGECGLALAGGVKLQLVPELDLALNKAGMLAPDGQCKTFDASADGYVRGEGCGLLVLKRLSDARRDGDRVRAVIRQTVMRQDGVRSGLTVPDGKAQRALIRKNVEQAGLLPADIDYVEAHGTGTRIGDPIEYNALVDVFGADEVRQQPLMIGSVKTNIGHLEAGAGIAGLIKAILAVEQAKIPPHLNLHTLNPAIDLDAIPARIPQETVAWPAQTGRSRRAAVTSFGFTGTIAHALLEQAPEVDQPSVDLREMPSYLLALSAGSPEALQRLESGFCECLKDDALPLLPLLNSAHRQREHLAYRRAVVAPDRQSLLSALEKEVPPSDCGRGRPRVAFLFTGQGAQYNGMAKSLFELDPAFREALRRADDALETHLDARITEVMFSDDDPRLHQTAYTQPALFAVGYALASMWRHYGVEPYLIAGHSIGEIAASVIAGSIDLETAARFVCRRGALMQELPAGGAMAAVRMSAEQAKAEIADFTEQLSIAAINGPEDVVLSGDEKVLEKMLIRLEATGTSVRRLTVSHAFHSPLMNPVLEPLSEFLGTQLDARQPDVSFYSTLLGDYAHAADLGSSDYWCRHARQPVLFGRAVEAAVDAGCTVLLEIGPSGILTAMARRALAGRAIETFPAMVASLRQDGADLVAVQNALASLYELGVPLRWSAVSRGPVLPPDKLPLYPFDRHRYWFDISRNPQGTNRSAESGMPDAGIYAMGWAKAEEIPTQIPSGQWIFVGGDAETVDNLTGRLQVADTTILAVPPEDFVDLDASIVDASHIVFLEGLKLEDDDLCDPTAILQTFVQVAKVLQKNGAAKSLMVPTVAVNGLDGQDSHNAAQAILWGAGRSIAFEAPNIPLRLVDLDPAQGREDALYEACTLLPALTAEQDMISVRSGELYSPRLTPIEDRPENTESFRDDGVYLIAGGAGALGRRMTEWLAGKGVRHFLWLGRSEPASMARTLIGRLSDQGVSVRWRKTDISDADDMETLFAELSESDLPLRGILHCAGVGRFSRLEDLTNEDLEMVASSKVAGSRLLDKFSRGHDLDLFLMFSSISGVWGSRLQVPYGAANAYQDALARKRQSLELPALAIAWGPWGGGAGMSELDDDLLDYLRRAGIHRLEPDSYLALLEPLLALSQQQGRPDYVCVDVTWKDFLPLYTTMAGTDLFEYCGAAEDLRGSDLAASAGDQERASRILALAGEERRAAVEQFVISTIAAILRADAHRIAPDQDLIVLGLDSILVMDFVRQVDNAFGIRCALRQVFDTPTPAALADYVDGLIAEKPAGEDVVVDPDGIRLQPDLANRHEPFPLTELQHAYWAGRSGAFAMGNIACHAYLETETALTGPELAEQSWNALILRHDCLRLVIDDDGRQRILREVPEYKVQVADLREEDETAIEAHIAAWREELSHQVLAADQWPLFDVRATMLPGGRTRLHFSIDMLINDATSSQILWDELGAVCAAGGSVKAANLRPFEISFRDYVVAKFDRDDHRQAEYDRARDYWLAKLPDLPPAPDLPLARDPDQLQTPDFRRYSHEIPAALWEPVKNRAAGLGLTPASLLISAFADVLAAWSNNPAFTINLTIFDRRPWHDDVPHLVGDFTSVTLLAVDRDGNAGFAENAVRLHRNMVDDLQHRAFSAVDVMRELNAKAQGRRHLMPVVFTSQFGVSEPTKGTGDDDPLGRVTHAITQTPQVWIDQQVTECDGALVFNWDVVEDLFPEGMVAAMFDAYRRLLEQLAEDEESWKKPVGPMLPDAQWETRRQVNDTKGPLPRRLMHAPFLSQVAKQGDALALAGADGREWSYSELCSWACRIGNRLLEDKTLSCGKSQRVAVVMEKGPEQVAAVLGIHLAGKVYVPIDPAWPDNRIASILNDGGIEVMLTQPWRFNDLMSRIGGRGRRVIDVSEAALVKYSDGLPDAEMPSVCDPAYVIYTSGSTGTPKGVVINHRGALNTCLDVNRRFKVGRNDCVFGLSALSFDLSVYDIYGTLAAGGALVLPSEEGRRDPAHWSALCRHYRVTVWNSVPALLDMMLVEDDAASLASLKKVFLSGDWVPLGLPERLKARAAEARLVCMGGATEASIWSNHYTVEAVDPAWKSIPYGYPLTNQGYRILDGAMNDRPDWVTGDLYITGDGLALCYDGDAEKTAASFLTHPVDGQRLYKTGDLARYWPNGVIEFLGRKDSQVKVGGHRIELGEIESAMLSHTAIRDSVCDAVGADGEIKRLVAWFTAEVGQEASEPCLFPLASCDRRAALERYDHVLAAVEAGLKDHMPTGAPAEQEAYWDLMDILAAQCVRDCCRLAGLFAAPSAQHDWQGIRHLVKPDKRFETVLESWLDILVSCGDLEQVSGGWVSPAGLKDADWDALISRAAKVKLPADPLLRLRQGAADRLAVIQGKEDALSLFYGADDALSPEHLSRLNPLHSGALSGMRVALERLMEDCPEEQPLRVLEIGARSGLSGVELLSGLRADGLRYTVTDTSKLFLDQAQRTMQRLPDDIQDRVEYLVFDPDRNPATQGFGDREFDLVVSFNALHRSLDVNVLLENLSSLLAPGGTVLAPEITRNSALQAVTVALLEEGYRNLKDQRAEAKLPLLSGQDWQAHLEIAGFEKAVSVAPGEAAGRHYGLHVITACNRLEKRRFVAARLQDYLRSRLPQYMLPQQIMELDRLPLGANGKVDRKRLPKPAAFTAVRRHSADAETPEEIVLAGLWQALLGVERVGREDGFFDLGGDSLIAVRLVERVRGELDRQLSVRDVFEAPSLQSLALRLAAAPACQVDDDLPELVSDRQARHDPFPLTDVQQAYWIGRQMVHGLGGVSTYLYTEIDVDGVPLERLESAWNLLIARHEMLRAVVHEDGSQVILKDVSHYTLRHRAGNPESDLAEWRTEMSHQMLDTASWPLFDIRAVTMKEGSVRLLVGLDNIICDGRSMQLLLREWSLLVRGGADAAAKLPALDVSFRDYVLAEEKHMDSGRRKHSLTYWMNRMQDMAGAPTLPLAKDPSDIAVPSFQRLEARLDKSHWQRLKDSCTEHGITPNALLLTAYAQCLANWSGQPDFTLNLTLFNRLPIHPQVDDIVGDFTSLVLLEHKGVPTVSFLQAAQHLQQRLWQDLDHMQISAVRAIREYVRSRSLTVPPSYPVVFTSGLGVDMQAGNVPPLGRFGYGITQTPQVWIDQQVTERDGELVFNWDVVEGLFPDGMIEEVFDAYHQILLSLGGDEAAWHRDMRELLPDYAYPAYRRPAATSTKSREPQVESPQEKIDELVDRISALIRREAGLSGDVPTNRTFFELGLTSLMLIRLRQVLQREIGTDFQVVEMFTYPTVEALARRIAGQVGVTAVGSADKRQPAVPPMDKKSRRNRRLALKNRERLNPETVE